MRRALVLLREQVPYRREAFIEGLKRQGFDVTANFTPTQGDVLVIWNRYGDFDRLASEFEKAGAQVIVAENGYFGREWRGKTWYAISVSRHNGAGAWHPAGSSRWNSWGVELKPWRAEGRHIVVLLQRGIGSPPVQQPPTWELQLRNTLPTMTKRPIRWRAHPGEKDIQGPTLEQDLEGAHACITWTSGAAIKALVAGIPVFSGCKEWIGAPAAMYFDGHTDLENPYLGDRSYMFERLAWALWSLEEIRSGECFAHLLR